MATLEIQLKNALEALDGEDTTADIVAERLKAGNHRGTISKASSCPVANYIKDNVDLRNDQIVIVHPRATYIYWGDCTHTILYGQYCVIATPQSIEDFINAFDNGDYPELRRENV